MDISRFWDVTKTGIYESMPSRHGGFVYATDGWIAVRVPDDRVSDADRLEQSDRSPLIEIFDRCDADHFEWHPLPPLTPTNARRCATCDGSGQVKCCSNCGGAGKLWDGGPTYECVPCHAIGLLPVHGHDKLAWTCCDCGGFGIDRHTGVEVGAGFYALRYLMLIAEEYPDAEIGVPYNDPDGMAMWRAPGVIGALMPIRR